MTSEAIDPNTSGSTLSPTPTAVSEFDSGKDLDIRSHLPLDEAHNDFWGLPSNPLSIYHTGPAWPLPTGPQAQRVPKEARPICTHDIASVWPELGTQIYQYFDSIELKWTSIDPVRFAEVGKAPGPLFLWVGVLPGTLFPDAAKSAALHCKTILQEYQIIDVEIAFRESVFTRYAAHRLLKHVPPYEDTADVCSPFTPALGLQIASQEYPYLEGTGCLYMREGGGSNRVFLLTARHVALPSDKFPNILYHRKNNSMPRHEIIHLGSRAFQNALAAIREKIDLQDSLINTYKADLEEAVKGADIDKPTNLKPFEDRLAGAEAMKASVEEFRVDILKRWCLEDERSLGHVVYAPPISVNVGENGFTEDWALIELNQGTFDWDDFRGNVIHLGPGARYNQAQYLTKMYPHTETRTKFKYPHTGLMQLRDYVRDNDLRHPTMLDKNGEDCLIVIKNGYRTGVTIGRATGIKSFVRVYDYGIHSTSMEIAVHPYGNSDGPFSKPGDSGAVVADANSRIVGMLTGGAGLTDRTDVTYVSPYYFLLDQIQKAFPNCHLYPIPAPIPDPVPA